jgi:hypothetical protein
MVVTIVMEAEYQLRATLVMFPLSIFAGLLYFMFLCVDGRLFVKLQMVSLSYVCVCVCVFREKLIGWYQNRNRECSSLEVGLMARARVAAF